MINNNQTLVIFLTGDYSGITLDKQESAQIVIAAREIMHRYGDAFYLRNTAYDSIPSDSSNKRLLPFANGLKANSALLSLLINHITWEALSQIRSFGFSDKSALQLVGSLIRRTVQAYDGIGGIYVDPMFEKDGNMIQIISEFSLVQRNILKSCYNEAISAKKAL